MTKNKYILNTMAADDLAPQGAMASASTEQYTRDMSTNQVDILINKKDTN